MCHLCTALVLSREVRLGRVAFCLGCVHALLAGARGRTIESMGSQRRKATVRVAPLQKEIAPICSDSKT